MSGDPPWGYQSWHNWHVPISPVQFREPDCACCGGKIGTYHSCEETFAARELGKEMEAAAMLRARGYTVSKHE